ncbi:MAG TPA: M14 family metallopeptidase [Ignavibacteriaceae bacterium]|nr:M14 family metallopeptidase [Ignavibacteriaceae bacterium]
MKTILITVLLSSTFLFSQSEEQWLTKFEKSGFVSTADYTETMQYFKNLADNSDYAELFSFGISPQGRELNCIVVSKDKDFTPEDIKKNNKPIVLIINGIHAGEIEGKDASKILLREILITKEKEFLIDNVVLMVVPIFSVDGHERKSKYNRINQDGPEEMGWRTTAQGYNLNREWMKADAPEMQSMLLLVSEWDPDFIIDNHTTNGADYQYTVTYQVERFANIYHKTAEWLKNKFVPHLIKNVEEQGYLMFPYVALRNWREGLDSGISDWASGPRLSTGYFALQNRPSLLVETHMIKPYKERVYSTKAVLENTIDLVNKNAEEILNINKEADDKSINQFYNNQEYLPLAFNTSDKFEEVEFKGIEYHNEDSDISGSKKIVYTGKPKDMIVKFYNDVRVQDSVKTVKGYYIPSEWKLIVDRLKLHGVEVGVVTDPTELEVTRYKFNNVRMNNTSNEGRQRVSFEYETYKEKAIIPVGSFYVSTNQRTVRVITHLLEPKSPDSFVQWGFMNQIFEQKEYFENYVMEPMAEEMLKNDPELKKEFEKKLAEDEAFRNNPYERLNFFYKRSPYWDKALNLYPIVQID